jgi:hypothetical protein
MFLRIGLIGAPKSGKSLIGRFFVENKGFKQFAFADKIKQEFFLNSSYAEKDFEYAKKKDHELEKKIRQKLWKYSDNMRKKYGELYFIKPLLEDIKKYDGNVIVTDIRTPEELCALKSIGMEFLVVVRDIFPNREVGVQGTRLTYDMISKYKVFWNYFDNLDMLSNSCERMFGILLAQEEKMEEGDDSIF